MPIQNGGEKFTFDILNTGQTSHGHVIHICSDIVAIAFLATLCGKRTFEEMEVWSILNEQHLKKYLLLLNGLPDDDTLRRCIENIEIEALAHIIYTFLEKFSPTEKPIYSDASNIMWNKATFQTFQVPLTFIGESEIIIGKLIDKSGINIMLNYNVLELFNISSATVTVDATFAIGNLTRVFSERGVNYAIYFNKNHKNSIDDKSFTYSAIENYFNNPGNKSEIKTVSLPQKKKDERLEKKSYAFSTHIEVVPDYEKWKNLKAIGMVKNEITEAGTDFTEIGYYLLSSSNMNRFVKSSRDNLSTDEHVYYALDVVYDDEGYGAKKSTIPIKINFIKKLF